MCNHSNPTDSQDGHGARAVKHMRGFSLQDGVYRTSCLCGWRSEPHAEYTVVEAEYERHVVDQLGEDGAYYEEQVLCTACAYNGLVRLVLGARVDESICPSCSAVNRMRPLMREGKPDDVIVKAIRLANL